MHKKKSKTEQKENNLFLKKVLHFETTLHDFLQHQRKFCIFRKDSNLKVSIFEYLLIRDSAPIFVFWFPEFWGQESEFIFRHTSEALSKKSWTDSLRIRFVRKVSLDLESFLESAAFYLWLSAEISLIPPHKIKDHALQIEEFCSFRDGEWREVDRVISGSRFAELLKVLKKPSLNESLVESQEVDSEALLFKRMGRTSVKKSETGEKVSFNYFILPVRSGDTTSFEVDSETIRGYLGFQNNLEQPDVSQRTELMEVGCLAKAVYGGKACYVVSEVIESPKTNKVLLFFQKLGRRFPEYTLDKLSEFFQISLSDAAKMTFDDFLHSGESSPSNISKYKDVSETCGITYNRSDCVYVLRTMIGWRSFKFEGRAPFYSRDLGAKVKSMNLIILSCHHLKRHFFPAGVLQTWGELPFLLSSFHVNWRSRGLWKSLSLKPATDVYLQQALALKSFCAHFNLETLETLGDSVLKFLTSMYLFWKFDPINESQMTQLR